MRCATASQFRKGRKNGAPCQEAPRPGTRTRELYDLLQANRGTAVELDLNGSGDKARLIALENYYGLDIRHVQRGYHRFTHRRPSLWLLAGEWFGRVYVDYVINREGAHQ